MKAILRQSLRRLPQVACRGSTLPRPASPLSTQLLAGLPSTRNFSLGKGYDVLGDVDEENPLTNINGYGKKSFSVTNVYVTHSVALFPRSFLLWNVRKPGRFYSTLLHVYLLCPSILLFLPFLLSLIFSFL